MVARRSGGWAWGVVVLGSALALGSCRRSSDSDTSSSSGTGGGPPRAVFPASYAHPDEIVSRFATAVVKVPVGNTGTGPLDVQDVVSQWACVRVLTGRLTVAPGRSGTIDLSYAPDHEVGELRIPLSFKTNDPERGHPSVTVVCRVVPALEVSPAVVELGRVAGPVRGSVSVINRSPRPVRLLYATSAAGWLTLEVPREPVPPGGRSEVVLSVGPGFPQGALKASARIAHDLTEVGPLTVAVRGRAE